MFKNKHVVIAMLVAPVLAIMAWFAVDYFVAERPHAAQDGAAYTLVAKSSCRYESGKCELANGDFELVLRPLSMSADAIELELASAFPLQSASLGLVEGGDPLPPTKMESVDEDATLWTASIGQPQTSGATIRIAVTASGATWYSEVPTVFLENP